MLNTYIDKLKKHPMYYHCIYLKFNKLMYQLNKLLSFQLLIKVV
jgi:hypothetical protein